MPTCVGMTAKWIATSPAHSVPQARVLKPILARPVPRYPVFRSSAGAGPARHSGDHGRRPPLEPTHLGDRRHPHRDDAARLRHDDLEPARADHRAEPARSEKRRLRARRADLALHAGRRSRFAGDPIAHRCPRCPLARRVHPVVGHRVGAQLPAREAEEPAAGECILPDQGRWPFACQFTRAGGWRPGFFRP